MAAVELTLVSGAWLLFALAALTLAGVIVRERPDRRENLALVALLVQQAAAAVLSILVFAAVDPALAEAAFDLAVPVRILWAPIVFLCAPLLLRGAAGRGTWLVAGAGAAPVLGLLAWGLVEPGVLVDPTVPRMTPAAAHALFTVFVAFAVTVVLLAREALTADLPTRRAQFALLAAAFSVEGGYHAAENLAKLVLGLDLHGLAETTPLLVGITATPALIFAGLAAWIGTQVLPDPDADRRRWGLAILGFLGVAGLTGAAASGLRAAAEMGTLLGAFHVFWDLVALALVVYAGLRFQLFGIERHAKKSVAVSAAVVPGFLLFVAVQEVVEGLLADQMLLGVLPSAGVVAGVAVAAASLPLRAAGVRLAAHLFPQVEEDPGYEVERKRELYRSAVEGALADGVKDPDEAQALEALRTRLGLSEDAREEILDEVWAAVDEPGPGEPDPGRATEG
jgi:hypothetical protein